MPLLLWQIAHGGGAGGISTPAKRCEAPRFHEDSIASAALSMGGATQEGGAAPMLPQVLSASRVCSSNAFSEVVAVSAACRSAF